MLGSGAYLAARSGRCGNSGAAISTFLASLAALRLGRQRIAHRAGSCSEEEEAAAADNAGAAAKAMAEWERNLAGGSMVETRKLLAAAMGRGRVGCHCLRCAGCHGAEAERVATEWSGCAAAAKQAGRIR
jgi:hypothetical protein